MSEARSLPVVRTTYRNERAYPFCPGCGHARALDRLDAALVSLARDPREVVIVSDIGCSGLSDQYFVTDAFHGLHGRSITYATGIKLARPDLTVVVVMGDGGTGIGGAHLLAAARRNIGITVLVLDNLNFGMTGGQHSPTTPDGALTATTPRGNVERPLDLCATVGVNGAAYACRCLSTDDDLSLRIAEAIDAGGFALLDVWGPCTAHFAARNGASQAMLAATRERLGFATGVLHRAVRPEFTAAYAAAPAADDAQPSDDAPPPTPRFESALRDPRRLVVAGSAGAKVRSATRVAARAALLSNLHAAQRDDYPVTVQSGHCVSSLVVSPEEIHHAGIEAPDVMVVLSASGAARVAGRLAAMASDADVFVAAGVEVAPTAARVHTVDAARASVRLGARQVSLYTLTVALLDTGTLARDALAAAAASAGNDRAREAVAAVLAV